MILINWICGKKTATRTADLIRKSYRENDLYLFLGWLVQPDISQLFKNVYTCFSERAFHYLLGFRVLEDY